MDVFKYLGGLVLQVADFWLWGIVGLALLVGAVWLFRRTRFRITARVVGTVLFVLSAYLLLTSGYQFWFTHRPLPESTRQTLFDGVTYIRDARSEPRPLVIHVVTIDLDTSGLRFLVTPGTPDQDYQLPARTASQFLDEFDAQVAINGDFFTPWWSNGLWDYYPHIGDPVSVTGFTSSQGMVYGLGRPGAPVLYLSEDNQASFNAQVGEVYNAISGNIIFVKDGAPVTSFTEDYHLMPHPRTAVGLDESAHTLILIVVDGRQPNYSEGVSIPELADIAIEYGSYTALNLDGGGSSTLVMEGADGQPVVLNSPIDQRIPGRERAVGNHLGVYVPRSG